MSGAPERLTPEQAAAADPAVSAWVTASAGTGKTHVLVGRMLRLMLAGAAPDRVLAITFTKAAAAEMKGRVLTHLGDWARADDETLREALEKLTGAPPDTVALIRARRLFAHVLDTPGGLKVQTIHSFCQSLLARFPLEAGIPQSFTVMDERSAREGLADAIESVLARARDPGEETLARALAAISARANEADFGELMNELLRKRKSLERLRRAHGGTAGLIAAMRARLGLDPDESEETISRAASSDAALDVAGLRLASNALANGGKDDRSASVRIRDFLAAEPEKRAKRFDDYRKAFLTKEDSIRVHLATKPVLKIAPETAAIMSREAERVLEVETRRKLVRVAEATAAVYRLGGAMLTAYEERKATGALLDYDDLIRIASELLSERDVTRWVLYKLDGGLDHILIDEAQDTNPEQWRIVEALSDEFFSGEGAREGRRTVFAVGDVKQSIFSFQGAEPAAFDESLDRFRSKVTSAGGEFRDIAMNHSFRSAPAVLAFVDQVFEDRAARDGLSFRDAYVRHDATRKGAAGLVEIWPPEAPERADDAPWSPPVRQMEPDDPEIRLAQRIAFRIHELIGTGLLPARGRAMRPGDFLVLVRRRGEFVDCLVNTLKSLDVPVAGVDRMTLTEEIAVMDLIALGSFALLPEDDYTLAVVLKSPLIGLDEEALFDLAHDRGAEPLWRSLVRHKEEARFAAAHGFLAEALGRADFVPPFEFFSHVLGPLEGRPRLLARLGVEANDPIDEFLGLAQTYERIHPPSLQGFLHWVAAGDGEIKRDPDQSADVVRVMTVHGAKGLQAPVVILPDTCQTPKEKAKLLALPGNDKDAEPFFVWPVKAENAVGVVGEAHALARTRGLQEYHRLLYVALTRAEDRLYAGGWLNRRGAGRDPGCWYDLIAAARAMPGMTEAPGPWGAPVLRYEEPQAAPPKSEEERAARRPEPPPAWARSAPPPEKRPPSPLQPSRAPGREQPALSPLAGTEAFALKRGRLVHALLQSLPEIAEGDRRDAALRYLSRPAHGLDAATAGTIAEESLAVLDRPDFAPLFGAGSRAEVPLAGIVGGHAISGQIDRLLVTPERVWIVDYKTNRPPPEHARDVADAYLWQMAAYRALLQRIYPGREVRAALLWTVALTMIELPPGALDRIAEGFEN